MVSVKEISKLPDRFEGRFKCVYPTCITNKPKEAITPKFSVISKKPLRLKCEYCGRYIEQDQLAEQLTE